MSVSKNIVGGDMEAAENEVIPESAPTKQIPLPRLKSTSTVGSNGEKRSTWDKKTEFFLSCVGYAVGLGNIWRFPYLCYKHGGGAFLIPYFIVLVVCGIPSFFQEMSLGQFASLGPVSIWKISPLFGGLGYGMGMVSAIACIYYNVIIAWALYFIYSSYRVPWASCENPWNTPTCISGNNSTQETANATSEDYLFANTSIANGTSEDYQFANTSIANVTKFMTASEEFWFFNVLNRSSGIQDIGELQWHLVLCLFIAWILVFLCVIKGVKSSGKVVYVTATFPYLVLIVLLARTSVLPGAWNGIKYYLYPDFRLLLSYEVWINAASQLFYSLGVGWGALITMSSHNKFDNNVYRDAMCIPIINCITSILAGFVVFSIIGFMAHETGKNIMEVVEHGPGLAFIVYPQAVALFPQASFWSFMFFIMLLFVGLDTQFAMFETAVSVALDVFPSLRKQKIAFIAFFCFVLFLLGLLCVTQGGIYIVMLIDYYCAACTLMFIALFETIMISWFYGIDRFLQDIFLMTKKLPSKWWKLCWCFFTPLTITILLLSMIIQHKPFVYESYIYPYWSSVIGWNIALCSLIPIPVISMIRLWKTKGTLMERFIKLRRPVPEWGPALEENRIRYHKSLLEVPSRFLQSEELTTILTDASAAMTEMPTDASEATSLMPTDACGETSEMPTDACGETSEMPTDACGETSEMPTDACGETSEMPTDASEATNLMPADACGEASEKLTDASGAINEMLQTNVPQT